MPNQFHAVDPWLRTYLYLRSCTYTLRYVAVDDLRTLEPPQCWYSTDQSDGSHSIGTPWTHADVHCDTLQCTHQAQWRCRHARSFGCRARRSDAQLYESGILQSSGGGNVCYFLSRQYFSSCGQPQYYSRSFAHSFRHCLDPPRRPQWPRETVSSGWEDEGANLATHAKCASGNIAIPENGFFHTTSGQYPGLLFSDYIEVVNIGLVLMHPIV
jgi:hypothetical protein